MALSTAERSARHRAKNLETRREAGRAYMAQYREANREQYNAKAMADYRQHRQSRLQTMAAYREDHREEARVATVAWRESHPGYATERSRANPGKARAKVARREARIEVAGPAFTRGDWFEYLDLCGDRCLACGVTPERLTADHVVPLCKGGDNTIDNIQGLCQQCNSAKGIQIIDYRTCPWTFGPLASGGPTEGSEESLRQPAEFTGSERTFQCL